MPNDRGATTPNDRGAPTPNDWGATKRKARQTRTPTGTPYSRFRIASGVTAWRYTPIVVK
jgi:hypothetical protein